MDYIETLIFALEEEERPPDTPEYQENQRGRVELLNKIEAEMGWETAEKVSEVYMKWQWLESKRFFRYGLRLALELLRL